LFNKTGHFMNGAYYLAPDGASEKMMSRMMKLFHKSCTLPATDKSQNPHISIGRKLTSTQLQSAKKLFDERQFNIAFRCEGIHIRKFNSVKKQYEVIEFHEF